MHFFARVAVCVLLLSISQITLAGAPTIEGCQILPADNLWNRDISGDAIDPKSQIYINDILTGGNKNIHPDFGSNLEYGIPFVVVPGAQALIPLNIVDYADESDPGPYPIPLNAPVEGGANATGDRHIIALDKDNGILYELFNARAENGQFTCSSAAKFDLKSNATRTDGFTSADAAGLPILPGLVRYDEVIAGEINHAIRCTVHRTQPAHIAPATHHTFGGPDTAPPMGMRLRLKADFDISGYTGQALVIARALKKYGMMVADNGSDWYITGATDARWNDDDLNQLKAMPGSAFEVVVAGTLASGGTGGTGGTGNTGNGGTGGSGGTPSDGDLDDDGFSDEQEVVLNTAPTDGTSTPFEGAPAGTVVPLTVDKLRIKLGFVVSGKDTLQVAGTLLIPTGFDVTTRPQFVLDAGGVIEPFTLDPKGKAKTANGNAKVYIKKKKGSVAQQVSKFRVKLKGDFSDALSDENLTAGESLKDADRSVTVTLLFNRQLLQKAQPQKYSSKQGKNGKTKEPKI